MTMQCGYHNQTGRSKNERKAQLLLNEWSGVHHCRLTQSHNGGADA